ncbi:hypothetical protein ASD45_21075 [Pseudolabrys sp. Root1462]|uniref:DUF1036 domain-containing protein n=1 Tax=Pseudolabrys sp. Root1462 TaxID=1736466 RepID=UPI0007033BD9|nr:DUF1036 domain-containing protein [Pseudolabrys sp. Root1462]KQY97196.1 hypothetical protein ASD45_21075 [Pseudolabrys sp. Root1462]
MIRSLITGLVAAVAVCTATAARAELTLCNRTSYRMDVALGLEKRANVETRGWFTVDPGQCKQVIDGAYDADMSYIHVRTPKVYGSAPLPQNGNSDFCVRDGNFQISDGRGCPINQQVRFSAARPSDSPKGPAINLAEEADYDDDQARLAGIQRLLVIAGYDANPIDGVQGAKTQGAIARFLADRKLPADAASGADFFTTLINAAQNPEGHGFAWCNDTTYPVMAAIGTTEAGAIITRGWYRVEAGQCVRPELRGDPKKLYSYAEAVDDGGRAIKRGGTALAWGGTVPLCTRDGRFELSDNKDCAARGLNAANFAEVDLGREPATTIRFKEP